MDRIMRTERTRADRQCGSLHLTTPVILQVLHYIVHIQASNERPTEGYRMLQHKGDVTKALYSFFEEASYFDNKYRLSWLEHFTVPFYQRDKSFNCL